MLGWHLKEGQLEHAGANARVFFLAFFLQEFALVPTLQNFRKRALGSPWKFDIANLLQGHRRVLQQNSARLGLEGNS